MGPGAQMAALGAVAAGEYMENRNDKQDEGRVAAMQGQSMGMPGGAPPGNYPDSPELLNRLETISLLSSQALLLKNIMFLFHIFPN